MTELDDYWLIKNNYHLLGFDWNKVLYFLFEDNRDFSYQPLMYISLALDVKIFGFNPYLMKIVNLLWHIGAGFVLFRLIYKLTGNKLTGLIVATVFLIHPIQVENIAWTACRRQVLFGFFYFLSLYLYLKIIAIEKLKSTKVMLIFLWSVIVLFSFLSKYSSIILTATIPLIGVYWNLVRAEKTENIKRLITKQLPYFFFLMLLSIIFTYKNYIADVDNILDIKQDLGYSFGEYLLIGIKSFGFYFHKIFIPDYYSVYYPEAKAGEVFRSYSYYLYILLFACLFAYWIIQVRNKKWANAIVVLMIFLSIFPFSMRMFLYSDLPWNNGDRYVYTTIPFIIWIAVEELYKYIHWRHFSKIFLVVFIFLSALSILQIKVWNTCVSVFQHVVQKNPNSEFYRRLATAYLIDNELLKAYDAYKDAENSEVQNYINVPWWTHVEMSYILLRNKNKSSSLKELVKAVNRAGGSIDERELIRFLDYSFENYSEFYSAFAKMVLEGN